MTGLGPRRPSPPTSPCATSSARTSRSRRFAGAKAVAIVFYPYAFSGVCTGEMAGIRDRLADLLTFDTEVLAISCDPVYSLRAFADQDGLNFPLLSDFWPHGEVSRAYGVLDESQGQPAPFVVRRRRATAWCAGRCTTRCPRDAISTSIFVSSRPPPERDTTLRSRPLLAKSSCFPWILRQPPKRRPNVVLVEPQVTRDASGSTSFHLGPSDLRVCAPRRTSVTALPGRIAQR